MCIVKGTTFIATFTANQQMCIIINITFTASIQLLQQIKYNFYNKCMIKDIAFTANVYYYEYNFYNNKYSFYSNFYNKYNFYSKYTTFTANVYYYGYNFYSKSNQVCVIIDTTFTTNQMCVISKNGIFILIQVEQQWRVESDELVYEILQRVVVRIEVAQRLLPLCKCDNRLCEEWVVGRELTCVHDYNGINRGQERGELGVKKRGVMTHLQREEGCRRWVEGGLRLRVQLLEKLRLGMEVTLPLASLLRLAAPTNGGAIINCQWVDDQGNPSSYKIVIWIGNP
ncbi:hypothetical protein BGY98DRAFT_936391 [Russula aff. rugulosa BPL654]|nr:hypothetical protein BGY98DRAFT_936391 [Russula aff. rugulosa BPL654]